MDSRAWPGEEIGRGSAGHKISSWGRWEMFLAFTSQAAAVEQFGGEPCSCVAKPWKSIYDERGGAELETVWFHSCHRARLIFVTESVWSKGPHRTLGGGGGSSLYIIPLQMVIFILCPKKLIN